MCTLRNIILLLVRTKWLLWTHFVHHRRRTSSDMVIWSLSRKSTHRWPYLLKSSDDNGRSEFKEVTWFWQSTILYFLRCTTVNHSIGVLSQLNLELNLYLKSKCFTFPHSPYIPLNFQLSFPLSLYIPQYIPSLSFSSSSLYCHFSWWREFI